MTTAPTEKIDVALGDVQETLLIPAYLRARETERPDAICRDPQAVEMIRRMNYDFSKFDDWLLQLDMAIRTEIFDEQVARFVARHPDAAVINLGAGLDARFLRLDNGRIRWFNLDMPDSIALRTRLLPNAPRETTVASDVLDLRWIEDIRAEVGELPVLVVAEGLFCYLTEASLRELLAAIADVWPGAELLFQSISPEFVGRQGEVAAICRTNARFHWGIRSGKELETWRPDFQFLDEWAYVDRHPRRWRHLRWLRWFVPWKHRTLRDVMKISHLRLGEPTV